MDKYTQTEVSAYVAKLKSYQKDSQPTDLSWSDHDRCNYEVGKKLVMGLAASLFRDDIVLKTMMPYNGNNWNSVYVQLTLFVCHQDSTTEFNERDKKLLWAWSTFVNRRSELNGVTVEEVIRTIARSKLPLLSSKHGDKEKLRFVRDTAQRFMFCPQDGADKQLLERMCTSLDAYYVARLISDELVKVRQDIEDRINKEYI